MRRADDSGVHIAAADGDGEVRFAHLHPGGSRQHHAALRPIRPLGGERARGSWPTAPI